MQLVKPQVLIHRVLARTILGIPIRCAATILLAELSSIPIQHPELTYSLYAAQ
jgi:hypothetical protein